MDAITETQSSHRVTPITSPRQLTIEMPPSQRSYETVLRGRKEIKDILEGRDERLLVIVGPCSIHDTDAALDYAERLRKLQRKVKEKMVVVMRVYLEKPRTITGWKGLISDPDLDGTCDMGKGIRISRDLLLRITGMGLPTATEILDPLVSYYLGDLISWASIGARTSESQIHRQVASGLSMPVGFKNSTSGCVSSAIHAIQAARKPHTLLGTDREGRVAAITTGGNRCGHLVLRGGTRGPNYDREHCLQASLEMARANLNPAIIIDCNHENSGKQYQRQIDIAGEIVARKSNGEREIKGIMVESNIVDGNQKPDQPLVYGMSVTDPCLGWGKTERLLERACALL